MGTFLAGNPLAIFALLLVLSVVVPPLVRPLRLPDLVGLLAAGVAIGPHGLGWLVSTSETVRLLSDVGVIYLLFIAGLEIDLGEFQRIRARSFRFGLLTFTLPMLAGTVLGFFYGYPAVSAVLIGSILASHTPLGYPIVRSFGAMREECVTVAIGGTIFTDIAALVVLALCVSLGQGQLSTEGVVGLLLKVAVYAAAVLLLIRWLGRGLIRRSVDGDSRLFVAVLLALFLAAVGAELAGVEKIVGAFLAGLAVNGVLPDGRVKEQVVVVGASLFIPLFFIDLGLLLDVPVFLSTMTGSAFAVALILSLIASKGLASWWSGLLYRYDGPQMLTLWSLSIPQVAATLAATYVGFRQGLLDERMLNSVLALMVVTATLGPILTTVAMTRMASRRSRELSLQESGQLALVRRALRVLVPVSDARSEGFLLALAGRLIDGEAGRQGLVLPLAVVSPRQAGAGRGPHPPVVHRALAEGRQRLERADARTAAAGVPSRSLLRVDNDIPGGIARAALEQGADLVLVGVARGPGLGRWLFGDLVAAICRQAHCPVVMARLGEDPAGFRRLLVPVKDLSAGALEQFQLAERLLSARPPGEGAAITLLHVHEPWLPQAERERLNRQLQAWIPSPPGTGGTVPVAVELLADPNVAEAIERSSESHDLVILRSLRRLVEGLPIPASDQATGLLRRLACSVLVISDPLH
ncbi:Kef-type K+ transport system membrane protein [Cyanobium sp. Copco_Reservoir_LC18]|uniref:cation:proton antiporter n=1 Tax=Cyanobium sp. Copco_Reservoir_LC18 TaxID=1328305 RepID=UPI00135A5C79|nr:cation:proton antiporter [Cyanobium sp. Copco_Reservoir_LC18]KAF0654609.1 Kef-type K+ transport system membrane protein [Cyanobium sp. Copco_Reservoir_LC18]